MEFPVTIFPTKPIQSLVVASLCWSSAIKKHSPRVRGDGNLIFAGQRTMNFWSWWVISFLKTYLYMDVGWYTFNYTFNLKKHVNNSNYNFNFSALDVGWYTFNYTFNLKKKCQQFQLQIQFFCIGCWMVYIQLYIQFEKKNVNNSNYKFNFSALDVGWSRICNSHGWIMSNPQWFQIRGFHQWSIPKNHPF